MENLKIVEKDGANYHLYELEGALNAYTLGEFQNQLYEAVQKNNIILDMSKLIELDPAGIGFLMAAFNDANEAGHKLFFMMMSIARIKASLGGFGRWLRFCPSPIPYLSMFFYFLQKILGIGCFFSTLQNSRRRFERHEP